MQEEKDVSVVEQRMKDRGNQRRSFKPSKKDKVQQKKLNQRDMVEVLHSVRTMLIDILNNTLVIDNKVELLRKHMNEHRDMMGMPPILWEEFIKEYRGTPGGEPLGPKVEISSPEEDGTMAILEKHEPVGEQAPEEGNESTNDPDTESKDRNTESSEDA